MWIYSRVASYSWIRRTCRMELVNLDSARLYVEGMSWLLYPVTSASLVAEYPNGRRISIFQAESVDDARVVLESICNAIEAGYSYFDLRPFSHAGQLRAREIVLPGMRPSAPFELPDDESDGP